MDDVVKLNFHQKRLDMITTAILLLLLFLSVLFRASPVDFMNPGFPILDKSDLRTSDMFILVDPPFPRRTTPINDGSKTRYEIFFQIEDSSQIFPDSDGNMRQVNFTGDQYLTRFSNAEDSTQALEQAYKKYVEDEGDFPVLRTDIPVTKFSSKADHSLLWCNQYSDEPGFDTKEVQSCYYWSVYGPFFSEIRISMWPIVGGGRQYSVELFQKVITDAENKILLKINH